MIIFSIFLTVGYFISKPVKEVNTKEVFNEASTDKSVSNAESKTITAYINGEVKNPGVYKMKSNSRIQDLIKAAGGTTENANTLKLNLAKKLKDEDYIYVENKTNSSKNLPTQSFAGNSTGNSGDNQKVNINSASKEELKKVPGIGDVTAQKIIDYREKNGGFKTIQDLKKVGRIGDKTLEKIKDKIDVS